MVLMNSILVVTIPTMKSSEVIKRLEADGWYLARVKGSHHHFKHPDKTRSRDGSAPFKRHRHRHAEKYFSAGRVAMDLI
jgi:hypothetical protein